jgi:hypothetical protein
MTSRSLGPIGYKIQTGAVTKITAFVPNYFRCGQPGRIADPHGSDGQSVLCSRLETESVLAILTKMTRGRPRRLAFRSIQRAA